MKHKYTLAFCIPVYHAEKYIKRMIVSIAAQKVDFPMEIVLAVDPRDGTDYSALILPILDGIGIHLTEKHCDPGHGMSCGAARNEAFAVCDADYVWFVDADDWLCDERAAAFMVAVADGYETDVAECQFDGPFPCKQSRMMAWVRILSYDIAKDHPFPDQKNQEDRDMYIGLVKDPRYSSAKTTSAKFYHYDWGRADSMTEGKVLS
jgi:glycosyltransferase involved in cell wall biosynthesis